jgi:hypothetical protein
MGRWQYVVVCDSSVLRVHMPASAAPFHVLVQAPCSHGLGGCFCVFAVVRKCL